MTAEEFGVMCSAYYAVYQFSLMIWAGAVVGVGILAAAVMGIVIFIRRFFPLS